MKILLNKTESGQAYLNELLTTYKIKLDYGSRKYKYTKPFKKLEDLSPKGKQFIESGGVKTPYYLIDYPLPDSKKSDLKELRIVYHSLHNKYTIWGWDKDRTLVSLEYVSEDSVKLLVNAIEKEKNK